MKNKTLEELVDPRILDVLERNGWNVNFSNGRETDLEWFSPAGEDFCTTIYHRNKDRSFVKDFTGMANDFDPEEHAEMWIPMRGRQGTPNSVRELLDDAEAIAEHLNNTASELRQINFGIDRTQNDDITLKD